ncbi:uncharacterized protein TrAtP1_000029 [Trichoderma atroviride]|uniref:uncharacterized protein n=1 Tax=Hypocrea atroviridis TaxID=63577 RepID=UPI0033226289|nr:hypothetical protein TrAtP1_000029 [Trichoderma atroviride]
MNPGGFVYAKGPEIVLPPIAAAATLAQVPKPTLLKQWGWFTLGWPFKHQAAEYLAYRAHRETVGLRLSHG